MNISKELFLEKYNFEYDVLEKYNISWETLTEIYLDFVNAKEKLEEYANLIAGLLRKQEKVHTVRTRIKDPEHLIAKLIRKTPERRDKYTQDFEFTTENYKEEITDLIGVRVIHIFKEDWLSINNFVNGNWNVKESQANVRDGDNQEIYTERGIQINSRKTGYRSVHYLIEFMPTNEKITAEIQVRTIFEEGYGEVDHQLSYPNNNVPEVLTLNLLMLNRLAGSADEMASAVKTIKEEWSKMQLTLDEKEVELEKLKAKIEKLDIKKEQKESLVKDINNVKINKNIYSFNLDSPYKDALNLSVGGISIQDPYKDALNLSVGGISIQDSTKNSSSNTDSKKSNSNQSVKENRDSKNQKKR